MEHNHQNRVPESGDKPHRHPVSCDKPIVDPILVINPIVNPILVIYPIVNPILVIIPVWCLCSLPNKQIRMEWLRFGIMLTYTCTCQVEPVRCGGFPWRSRLAHNSLDTLYCTPTLLLVLALLVVSSISR